MTGLRWRRLVSVCSGLLLLLLASDYYSSLLFNPYCFLWPGVGHNGCRPSGVSLPWHGSPMHCKPLVEAWWAIGCSHWCWSWLELAVTGPGWFIAYCHRAPHSHPPPHLARHAQSATLYRSAESEHIKILADLRRCVWLREKLKSSTAMKTQQIICCKYLFGRVNTLVISKLYGDIMRTN